MNRVEWELYGTTNADAVVDKTVKGLDGIEKNAKRVENAFAMSVSSIFLRFLGPMALLQMAISSISEAFEKSKQQAQEATDLSIKGESKFISPETSYLSKKYAAEDQAKKEEELAKIEEAKNAERYLREGNAMKVMSKVGVMGWLKYGLSSYSDAASGEDMQKAIRELTAEEMKAAGPGFKKPSATDFKGPEGFSNVVGVGASPVLDAMTQQLSVQRDMLNQLEIANQNKTPEPDFTKGVTTFRATPYGL